MENRFSVYFPKSNFSFSLLNCVKIYLEKIFYDLYFIDINSIIIKNNNVDNIEYIKNNLKNISFINKLNNATEYHIEIKKYSLDTDYIIITSNDIIKDDKMELIDENMYIYKLRKNECLHLSAKLMNVNKMINNNKNFLNIYQPIYNIKIKLDDEYDILSYTINSKITNYFEITIKNIIANINSFLSQIKHNITNKLNIKMCIVLLNLIIKYSDYEFEEHKYDNNEMLQSNVLNVDNKITYKNKNKIIDSCYTLIQDLNHIKIKQIN